MAVTRKCDFCSRSAHQKAVCPAREATCFKCRKVGHWGSLPVDEIGGCGRQKRRTGCRFHWRGEERRPTMDTGADVTVISAGDYRRAGSPQLEDTRKTLVDFDDCALQKRGKFTGKLSKDGTVVEDIFVIGGQRRSLLSRHACKALNLVRHVAVDSVETADFYKRDNPKLLTGLGRKQGDYAIKLRTDATPFALSTPRRVSIPLLGLVEKETQRMEDLQVIRRVVTPTDWCAGMVVMAKPKVVPLSSGGMTHAVRIYVNLTGLNESVLREKHDLPLVDQTLGQLAGAKILDANSSFWQIPLARASQELTTFINPFGRYYFERLPFGITSAPEHFQKRLNAILERLPGVLCMMDIIIFGASSKQHDERVRAVFRRLDDNGVTLNIDECEFAKSSITYLGHVVTTDGIKADPAKVRAVKEMLQPSDVSDIQRFLDMANQLGKFLFQLGQ